MTFILAKVRALGNGPRLRFAGGRLTVLGLLLAMGACGGGGGSGSGGVSESVAGVPSAEEPGPGSGYDIAAEVAAIRRHAGYGAAFAAGTNPNASGGLALPTPPSASCLSNAVTVTSIARFNAEATGSCKRITLAPSSTAYIGVVQITGQDIEAVFTGATITPGDDSAALQVIGDARRIKTLGGVFNNLYLVGGHRWSPSGSVQNFVEDVHVAGASFTGLYTQGLSTTYYGDGAVISAHRFLLERSAVRSANGAFFVEPGSTNIVMANSNIVVIKLDRHENPVRINGSDLIAILDSRLRTELGPGQTGPIKHTWRMHGGSGIHGGRMIVRRVQSEGGGASGQYPGVEGSDRQSTLLVVQGWRYYRAPEVEGNNVAAFPYLNTYAGSPYLGSVMNAQLWMDDNIVYNNDLAPGTGFMAFHGSNTPPGSLTNSVYAAYVAPPTWSFR